MEHITFEIIYKYLEKIGIKDLAEQKGMDRSDITLNFIRNCYTDDKAVSCFEKTGLSIMDNIANTHPDPEDHQANFILMREMYARICDYHFINPYNREWCYTYDHILPELEDRYANILSVDWDIISFLQNTDNDLIIETIQNAHNEHLRILNTQTRAWIFAYMYANVVDDF